MNRSSAVATRAVLALGAALCTATAAQAEETGLSLEAGLLPAPALAAGSTTAADYRLWLGRGRAALGIGWSAAVWPPHGGVPFSPRLQSDDASTIVGMRYRLSDRSRLIVDSAGDGLGPERDLRMGFEFKPAKNAALGLARGSLLRVQWSSRSQLSLRLRGGGLTFAYRAQFY